MNEIALEARGLVKQFPGLRALDGVDIQLRRGEIHGLVGQNGAGKSTLIKILTGVLSPDGGTILRNGRPAHYRSPAEASRDGVAVVHQELSLVRRLSAAENLHLGRPYPRRGKTPFVDWGALNREAEQVLSRLQPGIPVGVPVGRLSPTLQTLVAIARALSLEASVLILDEPTASLTDEEVNHLFSVLRQLRSQGYSILYVSHRLSEVMQLCDRVTVLRDGRVVAARPTAELDGPELIRLMTGQRLGVSQPARRPATSGAPVLEVQGLCGYTIKEVSFTLRRGEIAGLAGLTGSGRSELLRLLAGAQRARRGRMLLDGRPTVIRSPQAALRLGVALVPEERRAQALVPAASVRENISLAHLASYAVGGWWLRSRAEERAVRGLVEQLSIRIARLSQPIAQLSGGNQQKAVFARFLMRPPKVLLLDEPTRGVDVATKFQIYGIIRDLAARGAAILMASSELPELLILSDRILVLHDGELVATMAAEGATEESLSAFMYGRRSA
ncbi:MAG: sugar ABC transporter ATP-binding protein [Bacillota bacterium]